MQFQQLGLRTKIILLNSAPILVVLLIAIVVLGALRESEEIRRSERVTNSQIAKALSIEKLVVDLETGQRGSIISGKEEFLEPYDLAKTSNPICRL